MPKQPDVFRDDNSPTPSEEAEQSASESDKASADDSPEGYEPPKRLSVETLFNMALPKDITGVIDVSQFQQQTAKQEAPSFSQNPSGGDAPPKNQTPVQPNTMSSALKRPPTFLFLVFFVLILLLGSLFYSRELAQYVASDEDGQKATETSSEETSVIHDSNDSEAGLVETAAVEEALSINAAEVTASTISSVPSESLLRLLEGVSADQVVADKLRLIFSEVLKRSDIEPLQMELAVNGLLEAEDFKSRIQVLKALQESSYMGKDLALRAHIRLLTDQEYLVRGFAAKGLGRFPQKEAQDALRSQLEVEKKDIVQTVIKGSLRS